MDWTIILVVIHKKRQSVLLTRMVFAARSVVVFININFVLCILAKSWV